MTEEPEGRTAACDRWGCPVHPPLPQPVEESEDTGDDVAP